MDSDDAPLEHISNGDNCWCNPRIEPVKREDGSFGWVIVHRDLVHELLEAIREDSE